LCDTVGRQPRDILVLEVNRATISYKKAGYDIKECGLPGTIRPHNASNAIWQDGKCAPLKGLNPTKMLC
jgi:hypothetical protein